MIIQAVMKLYNIVSIRPFTAATGVRFPPHTHCAKIVLKYSTMDRKYLTAHKPCNSIKALTLKAKGETRPIQAQKGGSSGTV